MAATNSPSVLPPAKLVHVVLSTNRFKPMVAFYKALLGAHSSSETDTVSFITYDDEHHRLAIVSLPEPVTTTNISPSPVSQQQHKGPGLEHVAFTYASLRDLVSSYRQRKALLEAMRLTAGVRYINDKMGEG